MAYTVKNFKTKKELKEAVAKWKDSGVKANRVYCYSSGIGPDISNYTGKVILEGPHYPRPRTWYARAKLVDGIVVKVS